MGIRPIDLVPPPDDRPPAVGLVPVDRLGVKVSGARAGEGPVTLGQANMLAWIAKEKPYGRFAAGPLELPAGCGLDDIVAAFEVLLARHESLRTVFPDDRTQRVLDRGELAIEVFSAAGAEADDQVLVNELIRELRSREFDQPEELPVRVAVAVSADGAPRAAAVVYSHTVVDLPSMVMLGRQFTDLAGDPSSRHPGAPEHQPLDQAAFESSDRGRRRAEAALRYWEHAFTTMPQCPFPVPPGNPDRPPGGSSSGWLWSRAAALALPHITARTGTSESMAVLAAVCAVISRRSGLRRIVMPMLTSNRFERRLRDYIGPLATDSLVSVRVDTEGFDELVRTVGTAVLRANRYPAGQPDAMARLETRVSDERGIHYARYCTFNDSSAAIVERRPLPEGAPADARLALGETTVVRRPWGEISALLAFRLLEKHGQLILGALTADRDRVTHDELELLLRGVERLLVTAAAGDVPQARLGAATGVTRMSRGPDWRLVDASWLQLSEVRRLLDDALPGHGGTVFAVADTTGSTELVAYLTDPRLPGARQAHLRCLAALPGRNTAMAPHRYVLCAGGPENPADLSAWQRRPVLWAGDGRERRDRAT